VPIGSGRWMPEAEQLALLRADIDRKPKKIRRVLTDARVRKHIFGGIPHDEKKAIKAFAESNAENALKTKPKVCPLNDPPFSPVCSHQGDRTVALARHASVLLFRQHSRCSA